MQRLVYAAILVAFVWSAAARAADIDPEACFCIRQSSGESHSGCRAAKFPGDFYQTAICRDPKTRQTSEVLITNSSKVVMEGEEGCEVCRPQVDEAKDAPRGERADGDGDGDGGDSGGETGPFWNAWFKSLDQPVPLAAIAPEENYTLTFDLSAFNFASAQPGTALGGPAAASLRELLDEVLAKGETKAAIWIRPVLLGVSAPQGAPLGRLVIDIAKLRDPPAELTRDYDQLRRGELALDVFAEGARAAVGDDGQPYQLRLRTGRAGCAAVAFSLWDDSGLKPIDQLILRFRVGPGGECPIDGGVEAFATGLESLLATMLGEPAASAGAIDAGLHVFEFEGMTDGLAAVALYVERAPEGFVTHSWRLSQPLTPYLADPQHFPKVLKAAQDAAWQGEPTAYASAARALSERIFGGYYIEEGDEVHDREAKAALESLRALADRAQPARVLARLVNSDGEQVYLPLRLLAAGGPEASLKQPIEVVQPLPREAYVSGRTCIEPWSFALPERIEGVEGAGATLLAAAERGPTAPWLTAPILDRDALGTYFAQRPRPGQPEGLLLLAHQGGGAIYFESNATFQYGDMKRPFAGGSVAVLAACSAAGIDADNRLVLNQLNALGIDTILAAPYQVSAAFGSRLAVKLAQFVHEVRSGTRGTTQLVALFEEAGRAVAQDVKDQQDKNIGDMIYEFHVLGDHGARLCPGSGG
jgi:hypothetical protein